MAKRFSDLTDQEILALAISLEEDDGRTYADLAQRLQADHPSTASILLVMQQEESTHRSRLLDRYRARFGEHIPRIDRSDVRGFVTRQPVWLMKALPVSRVRRQIEAMELETRRFYEAAARRTSDAATRQLLGDLAAAEVTHSQIAGRLEAEQTTTGARASEDEGRRRMFVLQVVQPGLVGLMDGSVSTLAPLFAAAFATHSSHSTLLVGIAASVGAGISMGFAEALSDDGELSGRGHPWARGAICGLMTTLGGIGHTLPYLIGDVHVATALAAAVVVAELGVISWIRHHYMDTPILSATLQIVVGGLLVFAAGILIGSS